MKLFFIGGQLMVECYKGANGFDGEYNHYYPDGRIKLRRNYIRGVKWGSEVYWDEEGLLVFIRHFVNGVLSGPCSHYEKGKLIRVEIHC